MVTLKGLAVLQRARGRQTLGRACVRRGAPVGTCSLFMIFFPIFNGFFSW